MQKLRLLYRSGRFVYLARVSGQNSGNPVSFRLVPGTGNRLVFENPYHDFPQRIIYHHFAADSLVAIVEGTDKGNERRETFRLSREILR